MQYNLDEIINRHQTDAIKIDKCKELFGSKDVIPMWVADMDFRTPDFVIEAIQKAIDAGHSLSVPVYLPRGYYRIYKTIRFNM